MPYTSPTGPGASLGFVTTTTLANGATYTSDVLVYEDGDFSQVQTEVLASHDGSMVFTFYGDAEGTDQIRQLTVPYTASDGYRQFGAPTFGRSVKYTFTNTSGSNQTDFYFSTKLVNGPVSPQVLALDGFLSSAMLSHVTRSLVVGADAQGNYSNVTVDDDQNLRVAIASPTEAFGAVLVSDLHPVAQRKWVQGLNSELDRTVDHNGGTVTASGSEIVCSTSTTTASRAIWNSAKIIGYRPGQAVVARFTARFTSPVAGTYQYAGLGDAENALAFGYDGTTFGVARRTGGQVSVYTLTVTGAPGGAGNVTVTLNGGAVVTALAGTETIAETAAKIADSNYATAGSGWRVYYQGDSVVFTALGTGARGGTYSFVDTDTTGTTATGPTQTLAPSSASETWVAQTAWGLDAAAGSQTLPAINWQNINVFQISYQWLGAGAIIFAVENPSTGRFVTVHRIEYANSATAPSLIQPDLPLYLESINGATSSDIVVRSASMAGFKAGEESVEVEARYSVSASVSTDTTRANVLTVRVPVVSGSVTNRRRVRVDLFSLGNNSSNRTSEFHITRNADLVGAPSWSAVGDGSIVEVDSTATDIVSASGKREQTVVVGAADGRDVALGSMASITLEPGDILTVSAALASGGTSSTQVASLSWSETS